MLQFLMSSSCRFHPYLVAPFVIADCAVRSSFNTCYFPSMYVSSVTQRYLNWTWIHFLQYKATYPPQDWVIKLSSCQLSSRKINGIKCSLLALEDVQKICTICVKGQFHFHDKEGHGVTFS